jgi:hypothetical protein
MKQKAKALLSATGIKAGQDFNTLTPDQLTAVSAEAAKMYQAKYGKPMPTDFPRKRYELLQMLARS